MTYQALGYGLPELWYYTFYDVGNDMAADTAKRNQLKRVIKEVALADKFWKGL
jgi:hypothetical protein